MHSSLHTLAHRGAPSATRAKARWQPYSSLESTSSGSSFSSRSPPSACFQTPNNVLPSPPFLSAPTSSSDDRIKPIQPLSSPPIPKESSSNKNKHALNLIDQAVKTLSDIWRPQDIPPIFSLTNKTSVTELLASPAHITHPPLFARNTQLPSPLSPGTRLSPELAFPDSCVVMPVAPIKGFVHEVLRRSRTSGGVLQTALCYLEAIRPKLSELVHLEKTGQGVRGEVELDSRIIEGSETETGSDCFSSEDIMDTVKVSDNNDNLLEPPVCISDTLKMPMGPSPPLSPLPPLPSPLLCPRRAFLASLILASKFTQDKCYSNRAWAKLSGLPPREIGRCERALGDALGWRLWVGKASVSSTLDSSNAPPLVTPTRTLTRCRSESNLCTYTKSSFLSETQDKMDSRDRKNFVSGSSTLRRCSTLPSGVFTSRERDAAAETQRAPETSDYYLPSNVAYSSETGTVLAEPPYGSFYGQDVSPETPGLSHSPSSTMSSSSSGGRTIQMTTFDDNMSGPNGFAVAADESDTGTWPWTDSPPPSMKMPTALHASDPSEGGIHRGDNLKPVVTMPVGIVDYAHDQTGNVPPQVAFGVGGGWFAGLDGYQHPVA